MVQRQGDGFPLDRSRDWFRSARRILSRMGTKSREINRLEVICHEDLDTLEAPHVFPFVAASLAASRDRYSKAIGEARLTQANRFEKFNYDAIPY